MSTLPFQIVAFDLDDTLLREDLSISAETLKTLHSLQTAGVLLIPASGRAQRSISPFVKKIGGIPFYIACNGAEIRDGKTDHLVHGEQFSVETGREIAAFGKRWDVYTQTYEGDYFFYNDESVWAERYAKATMLTGKHVGDLEAFIQEPRNKILMMDDQEKIARMYLEASRQFAGRASVTCSKPWFLEFNPLDATKGIALKRICRIIGIDVSRCIAFGDSLNDLPMLQVAGWGVLMGNGRSDLREKCNDICGTNQENGVAEYLKKVFREVLL